MKLFTLIKALFYLYIKYQTYFFQLQDDREQTDLSVVIYLQRLLNRRIINSNRMPPKKNRQRLDEHSQHPSQVVPIDQPIQHDASENVIGQILAKLQMACQSNPESLKRSLIHMLMRVCGLAEMQGNVDFDNIGASLIKILAHITDQKLKCIPPSTPIINHKDKSYSKYVQKLRFFLTKIMSREVDLSQKDSKWSECLFEWLNILVKSRLRCVRYSAVEFMRLWLQSSVSQYQIFLEQKQSKLAFQIAKEAHRYLLQSVKERLKQIDSHIRESLNKILVQVIGQMENDVIEQDGLQEIFSPILKDSNPKIVEGALQTLTQIVKNMKKIKRQMVNFLSKQKKQIQNIAVLPNRKGTLALKLLTQLHRVNSQEGFLSENQLTRIFQFNGIENYASGLETAVQAFYVLYGSQETIRQKGSVFGLEIMYLLNSLSSSKLKKTVLKVFLRHSKTPIDELINLQEMFAILVQEEYSLHGNIVSLKESDLQTLVTIITEYVAIIKDRIKNNQGIEQEKYKIQNQNLQKLGDKYNVLVMGNIKHIFFEKIRPGLAKSMLLLIKSLFIPLQAAFSSQTNFFCEKLVGIFERQDNIQILKEIVTIFKTLGILEVKLLCKHIQQAPQNSKPALIKKVALLTQFNLPHFATKQTVKQIISCYSFAEDQELKMSLLIGCVCIHGWQLSNLLSSLQDSHNVQIDRQYLQTRHIIFEFFFDVLTSRESSISKMNVLKSLMQIMKVACSDKLQKSDLHFVPSEGQIVAMYKFMDNQIGMPSPDNEDENNDLTRMINSVSISSQSNDQLLNNLFLLLQGCTQLMCHPFFLKLIAGALLAEQQAGNPKKNEISFESSRYLNNFYSREKVASKLLSRLSDKEVNSSNSQKFIFWRLIQLIVKQIQGNSKIVQNFMKKSLDIYFKYKSNKVAQGNSMNKALVFFMSQIDRIQQERSYGQLKGLAMVLKKLLRRINDNTMQRLFLFLNDRAALKGVEEFDSMIKLMENELKRLKKGTARNEEDSSDEQKQQEDGDEQKEDIVDERAIMLAAPSQRQTRNSTKRKNRANMAQ